MWLLRANRMYLHANGIRKRTVRSVRRAHLASPPQSGRQIQNRFPGPTRETLSPERSREQLSTQTHAQHRTIAPDQFCDEAAFFGQKGMLVCFISTHGTAHHNQALNIIEPRKVSPQIQALDVCMQASCLSFGSDQSGALSRYVLQYCPGTKHGPVSPQPPTT